jgi:hypothetical protein
MASPPSVEGWPPRLQTDFTDARTVCAAFAAVRDGIYNSAVLTSGLTTLAARADLARSISSWRYLATTNCCIYATGGSVFTKKYCFTVAHPT